MVSRLPRRERLRSWLDYNGHHGCFFCLFSEVMIPDLNVPFADVHNAT